MFLKSNVGRTNTPFPRDVNMRRPLTNSLFVRVWRVITFTGDYGFFPRIGRYCVVCYRTHALSPLRTFPPF